MKRNEWTKKTAASRRRPMRDTTTEDTAADTSTTAPASPIPYPGGPLPGPFKLDHERMARVLPRTAGLLRKRCFAIFANYGTRREDGPKTDLVNKALFTLEIVDQLLDAMESTSRAEHPGSEWLKEYKRQGTTAKEDQAGGPTA